LNLKPMRGFGCIQLLSAGINISFDGSDCGKIACFVLAQFRRDTDKHVKFPLYFLNVSGHRDTTRPSFRMPSRVSGT